MGDAAHRLPDLPIPLTPMASLNAPLAPPNAPPSLKRPTINSAIGGALAPPAILALVPQASLAQAPAPPPKMESPPGGAGFVLPLLAPLLLGGALLGAWRLCFPNCRPNQILVIAGRRHRRGDGQSVGYRVITGGRAFALPLLERCSRMDGRTVPVSIHVEKAYANGGTPIDVQAIATVKIDSDAAFVGNAIERFLDHDPKELVDVSRQTLEGHLRAMVAALSPEQVNEDRLRFAHEVTEVVQPEMGKLGLRLDTFKILRVSDRVEYYDSLGRARLAEVLRDAAIAEAEGFADADQREAEAQQRADVACTEARTIVQQAQNALRATRAQLDQEARQAEDRVEAAAAEARTRAEQALQRLRAELERRRLEADTVLPARAQQQAEEWRARGAAAATAETTKAAASVNDKLAAVWHSAGEQAATIFLLQQVETTIAQATDLARQLHLESIDVLESGNPAALAELVALYPAVVRGFLESARDILGIDVLGALHTPATNTTPSFTPVPLQR
ncbi:MAG: flotillin family protein [Cyanobacteriota bacterium]